ncbi:uncharacterized protein LOC132717309 isoform X2 [Ruditapes philippinarum]|uniref:uncharacterized protein LOC132717309 isoform X2 n=1 Tax=Ruditapes philippinarum TaxID=129788 RepID=UPI00295AA09F|nr:uncharacterized protein LOC132717309 isoform X2 [Ruditapes philippinarum]
MEFSFRQYLILVSILFSAGATFITENKTTWNSAIEDCKMETPTIMFQGETNDFSVKCNLAGKDDVDNVWVGYFLAASAFHYIGCMEAKHMTVKAEFKHNTPGLCYSACMTKGLIGISNKKCYCLSNAELSDIYNQECTKGCEDHDDIACGGDGYISLYRIESAAQSYMGDGECLLYEMDDDKNDQLEWSNCKDHLRVICASKNGTFIAKDETGKEQSAKWRDAMNFCLNNLGHPTSIAQIENQKVLSSSSSWVGVIRSDVIYSINDVVTTKTKKQFGYLHKTKIDDIVLKFEDSGTAEKKILCETERKPTTSGPTSGNTTESASDIGVPVGISIAIFLIVVIAVIAVLLLKRRAMLPVVCCRMFMSDKTQKDQGLVNNIAYDIPVNSPYDQIDEDALQQNNDTALTSSEDNRDDAHTYFVLEKDAKNSTTENVITGSKADKNENNVYNTLISNTAPGDNLDDTYDTAEKAAKRLKDQHDKEVAVEKGSTIGDINEDAYNHINDARMKKGKTDHVYGVPSDIGNDYGYAKNVHEQDHNVEDAYNHKNQ